MLKVVVSEMEGLIDLMDCPVVVHISKAGIGDEWQGLYIYMMIDLMDFFNELVIVGKELVTTVIWCLARTWS